MVVNCVFCCYMEWLISQPEAGCVENWINIQKLLFCNFFTRYNDNCCSNWNGCHAYSKPFKRFRFVFMERWNLQEDFICGIYKRTSSDIRLWFLKLCYVEALSILDTFWRGARALNHKFMKFSTFRGFPKVDGRLKKRKWTIVVQKLSRDFKMKGRRIK